MLQFIFQQFQGHKGNEGTASGPRSNQTEVPVELLECAAFLLPLQVMAQPH